MDDVNEGTGSAPAEPGPGAEPSPAGPGADELRQMWERLDPVPAGLADRVVFALEVDGFTAADLDLELLRLTQEQATAVGARGADEVRTVTFGSESTTVMLAISEAEGGHRVDGWVAPGGRRGIEVRTASGSELQECDETGRFTLPMVPPGHLQLVLTLPGEGTDAARVVITPALTL